MLHSRGYDTLDNAKTDLKGQIDAAAGRARARYITVVDGQDITYVNKEADALAYIAAGNPADATPYPWVKAEAEARGIAYVAAAQVIKNTADGWRPIGVAIEKERIKGKNDVDATTTVEDALSARNASVTVLDAV